MTSIERDLHLCRRCGTRAEPADRFCGGCGDRRPRPAAAGGANVAGHDAGHDAGRHARREPTPDRGVDPAAVTAPLAIPRPGPAPDDASTPPPAPVGATAQGGPTPVSARQEVTEVAGEVPGEWRTMSAGEKAGTVAASIHHGVAGLWNAALTLLVIGAAVFWLSTACSGGSLGVTASTTCDQYLKTDQQTRYTAAQDLGRTARGSTFTGPMAGLNLDYSCSTSRGNRTVGSIMGIAG